MKDNVLVIFGGVNCEHDISIITGVQVIRNLNVDLYNVIPLYIKKSGEYVAIKNCTIIEDIVSIPKNKFQSIKIATGLHGIFIGKKFLHIDVAIPCLHGRNGEDGMIAGVLKSADIPFTSCDILSSIISCDKGAFKLFCKGLSLPLVPFVSFCYNDYINNKNLIEKSIYKLGKKYIVKPANLGSSIGIEVCDKNNLFKVIDNAFLFDNKVIVEKFLEKFIEINIAVMKCDNNLICSNLEKPLTKNEILSFSDKYLDDGFEGILRELKPDISLDIIQKIKNTSIMLYKKLDMFGVVRFDFLVVDDAVFINEANTIPGSLANYLFDLDYSEMLNKLINESKGRYFKEKKIKTDFDSNVLLLSDNKLQKKLN